jgi:hypothetical protein
VVEAIAMLGSLFFAVCGVPPAVSAIRAKECFYSTPFLLMWGMGEGLMILFALLSSQYVLLVNYVPNAICLGIMVYYNKGLK